MGKKNLSVKVYSLQSDEIVQRLKDGIVHYCKREFIKKKYDDVAGSFLLAYDWYNSKAKDIVSKPEQAESGIWGFLDARLIEKHKGSELLKLDVPIDECVFFRMSDWSKLLNLDFIGEKSAAKSYHDELERNGIRFASDVCLTSFYLLLKRKLLNSWEQLFRYDAAIKANDTDDLPNDIQVGLWQIRPEWIV